MLSCSSVLQGDCSALLQNRQLIFVCLEMFLQAMEYYLLRSATPCAISAPECSAVQGDQSLCPDGLHGEDTVNQGLKVQQTFYSISATYSVFSERPKALQFQIEGFYFSSQAVDRQWNKVYIGSSSFFMRSKKYLCYFRAIKACKQVMCLNNYLFSYIHKMAQEVR